ncbi:MAG: AMP-binding protein [Leptospirales bacterium]
MGGATIEQRNDAQTLPDALFSAGVESKSGVHFFSRSGVVESHSYAELHRDARALAAVLIQEQGLRPGDTVALFLSTSNDFVRALFAVLIARATPTCLPTPRMGRMADYQTATAAMLTAARVKLVLTEANLVKNLASVAAAVSPAPELRAVPGLEHSASRSQAPDADQPGGGPEDLRKDPPEDSRRGAGLALIQFSSGTTVAPKPIALTHKNILSNTRSILASFPGDIREHSGCSWLPLHHDMGLIGGLFSAVVARGDMTFLRPEDFIARPAAWLRALSQSRATICPAPNFALQICIERVREEDIAELDLSRWKIALIGAETVREPTLRRFYERFQSTGFRYESFTPVYGLAEATLAVTFSEVQRSPLGIRVDREELGRGVVRLADPARTDEKLASHAIEVVSVGRPLAGIDLELRDGRGEALGADRVGRIYVRGDCVMAGYFERPAATAAAIQNAWLDTGDLGFIHDDELYIYGRERDIIILNGRNHDPQTIEFALDRVPALDHDRAAAVAVDDPERGTESFVVLVEKEKGRHDDPLEELARSAREAVISETGLIPESVAIIATGRLPRTTSGKIKRGASRTQYLSGELEILAESRRG